MTEPQLGRRNFLKAAGAAAAAALLSRLQTSRLDLPAQPSQFTRPPSGRERANGACLRERDGSLQPLSWEAAVDRLASALRRVAPPQVAFLLGVYPDHLYHLTAQLARALGGAQALRWSPYGDLEGQAALLDAARLLLGSSRLPIFDPAGAEVVFSFGASRRESWIASRTDEKEPAPYWVQFEPRCSPTAREADRWLPIRPGSEARLAQALWVLGNESSGGALETAAHAAGLPVRELRRLAELFWGVKSRLALPGGAALSGLDGLRAAEWILRLNLPAADSAAFFLAPPSPVHPELPSRTATAAELAALAAQMRAGSIKALIIHGVDLVGAFPAAFGLREALRGVETVVSLSPFLDATARCADLLLPDRAPDESWGYQVPLSALDRGLVSLITPRHDPRGETRSSADVLVELARRMGLGAELPYQDGQDFVRATLKDLARLSGSAAAIDTQAFLYNMANNHGWQRPQATRFLPTATTLASRPGPPDPSWTWTGGEQLLLVYADEQDGYEPQAYIHPQTALRLGLRPGERARLTTAQGHTCLPLAFDPGLHPQTLAVPWTPSGDPAPLELVGTLQGAAGGLVFAGAPVVVERAG